MNQLHINFENNKAFGGQLKRLYNLLLQRKVTCEDAQTLGIAGSAFARRIKDLIDKYSLNIKINKVPYKRAFDGKIVEISEYELVKGN